MNFVLMPSLKHIALVKVTTELWNLSDVRDLVTSSFYTGNTVCNTKYVMWCQVAENKVIEKASELPLPESLKKEIVYTIRSINLEVCKWKTFLSENCSLGNSGSDEENIKLFFPCWTPQGTVDQNKTAKALVKDDSLDIFKRYKLACYLCFEDDIKELCNSLPQAKKAALYALYNKRPFPVMEYGLEVLVVLWTCDIEGKVARFHDDIGREISARTLAFEISAIRGNKTAAEYYLQKLNPLERQHSFVMYAEYVANRRRMTSPPIPLYADVLYFLLSQMNEEQQVKVFQADPRGVLSGLLDWPWQSFFIEAANRTWEFLSEEDYVSVLRSIVHKVTYGFQDYDYHKLFAEFWKQGPSTCKKYVIGICASDGHLLRELFQLEDKDNVRLILKNASVKEKEDIIFHFVETNILWLSFFSDKWDLLKLLVQECVSSEEIMVKLKNLNQEFKCDTFCSSNQKNEFVQFLDDLISRKRYMESGNSSPSKRLKKLMNN